MEIRKLRYFIAVAEEKNFTRAAERLFIAQPPLSRQVRQLEEDIGVDLFEPGSRPLKLTEAGEFFYVHAQKLLSEASSIKNMVRRIGQIEHTLSVGFVASILYSLLPKLIRGLRLQHPKISISIHEMSTLEQIAALQEGRIDVGFGRIRIDHVNIRRVVLREEPLWVALPIGHHLTQNRTSLNLLDLITETILIFPANPRPSCADVVLSLFADRALQPSKILEVREVQVAIGLVAAGEGIAVVPSGLRGLRGDDVQYLPLNGLQTGIPVIMNIRRMDRSEMLGTLLNAIYKLYDEEGIEYTRKYL